MSVGAVAPRNQGVHNSKRSGWVVVCNRLLNGFFQEPQAEGAIRLGGTHSRRKQGRKPAGQAPVCCAGSVVQHP